MTDEFSKKLDEYLQKIDQRDPEATRKEGDSEDKKETFRQQFGRLSIDVIQPVLAIVAERLKPRRWPAMVVVGGSDEFSGARDGYVALHCSDDPVHTFIVARSPMYRIAFQADNGKVTFIPGRGKGQVVPIEEVQKPRVEELVFEALKECLDYAVKRKARRTWAR